MSESHEIMFEVARLKQEIITLDQKVKSQATLIENLSRNVNSLSQTVDDQHENYVKLVEALIGNYGSKK